MVGSVTVADTPHAREVEHLDIVIEPTDDGWWAAHIEGIENTHIAGVENTGVFGQGRTPEEAEGDVLSALHDLIHEPSPAERVVYRLHRWYANARDLLPAR
jgi:hypothetical protein